MDKEKFVIVIPDRCKYTGLLQCLVDPPHDFMSITMTTKGEDEPFREGKVIGRRCPEISGYLFRPMKVDIKKKSRVPALVDGDKIVVKVTLYKEGEPNKRTLSSPIQSLEQEVLVTDEKTKNITKYFKET